MSYRIFSFATNPSTGAEKLPLGLAYVNEPLADAIVATIIAHSIAFAEIPEPARAEFTHIGVAVYEGSAGTQPIATATRSLDAMLGYDTETGIMGMAHDIAVFGPNGPLPEIEEPIRTQLTYA